MILINTSKPFGHASKNALNFPNKEEPPYTLAQLLSNAKRLFKNTGLFDLDLQDFNQLPAANKMYDEFKHWMNLGWIEYMENKRSGTGQAGFHQANLVHQQHMQQQIPEVNVAAVDTQQAMEEMTNHTKANKAQIKMLTQLLCQLVNNKPDTTIVPINYQKKI